MPEEKVEYYRRRRDEVKVWDKAKVDAVAQYIPDKEMAANLYKNLVEWNQESREHAAGIVRESTRPTATSSTLNQRTLAFRPSTSTSCTARRHGPAPPASLASSRACVVPWLHSGLWRGLFFLALVLFSARSKYSAPMNEYLCLILCCTFFWYIIVLTLSSVNSVLCFWWIKFSRLH
ncbi:unnamed protein product [Urochloa humidicola]